MVETQKDGVNYVLSYLVGQRKDEMAKAQQSTRAAFNHYKGWIPSESRQGGSLIIAEDVDHDQLVLRGYKRVSDYKGNMIDRVLGKRGYYFAPVSGTAPFMQGVMQTVHQTASGVDPHTGYTIGEVMGGRIDDPQIVPQIEARMALTRDTRENLRPIFDDAGKVVAYERMADPDKLTGLNKSTDLFEMIGVWRGRQVEEILAQTMNRELVGKLLDVWRDGVNEGRTDEFVNVAALDPRKDPVLYEAVKLIPRAMWEDIRDVFGPDEFWVRRDLLLDTFGERQASVGDLFTGKSRWHPKIQREFENIALGIFGGNAYKGILPSGRKDRTIRTKTTGVGVIDNAHK